MVKEEVRNLSFLFTETGFVLDTVDREQQDSKWFQRFQEDKYSALYDFGFQERIHQLHASTGFLHRTAELYIHVLTSLSELEIAREQVQITLPVDIWEQLQKELPFAKMCIRDRCWKKHVEGLKFVEGFSTMKKSYGCLKF